MMPTKSDELRAELNRKSSALKNRQAGVKQTADPERAEILAKQSLEQRLAKVRAQREELRRNWFPFDNRDPGKAYQAVCHTSKGMMSDALARGWEIVRSGTNSDITSRYQKEDGTHVNGDTILMQMARETQECWALVADLEAVERIHGRNQYQPILAFAQENRVPVEVTEQQEA